MTEEMENVETENEEKSYEFDIKKLYVVMTKNSNNFRVNAAGLPMLVSRNFKIDNDVDMKLNLVEFCTKYGYDIEGFTVGKY